MKIEEPNYEVDYLGGIRVQMDWLAGGNFDGYVYQNRLKFFRNKQVILNTKILDDSKYDGEIYSSEIKGTFEFSDHKTITCFLGTSSMRGKILGKNKEYLAFTFQHPNLEYPIDECYKMIDIKR